MPKDPLNILSNEPDEEQSTDTQSGADPLGILSGDDPLGIIEERQPTLEELGGKVVNPPTVMDRVLDTARLTVKNIGENIQQPYTNLVKTTSLPKPVKKVAEYLDSISFKGLTGAGISAGMSFGKAIEDVKKGNIGTAALETVAGGGETALGLLNVVPGAAQTMAAFNVGGKALEDVSPKASQVANYGMTPFSSTLELDIKKGGKHEEWEQPASKLADVAYQFMLFNMFRKGTYTGNKKPPTEPQIRNIAQKIATRKTLTAEETRIANEAMPKNKAELESKLAEIQKPVEPKPVEPVPTMDLSGEKLPPMDVATGQPVEGWKPEITPKAEINKNIKTAMESEAGLKIEPPKSEITIENVEAQLTGLGDAKRNASKFEKLEDIDVEMQRVQNLARGEGIPAIKRKKMETYFNELMNRYEEVSNKPVETAKAEPPVGIPNTPEAFVRSAVAEAGKKTVEDIRGLGRTERMPTQKIMSELEGMLGKGQLKDILQDHMKGKEDLPPESAGAEVEIFSRKLLDHLKDELAHKEEVSKLGVMYQGRYDMMGHKGREYIVTDPTSKALHGNLTVPEGVDLRQRIIETKKRFGDKVEEVNQNVGEQPKVTEKTIIPEQVQKPVKQVKETPSGIKEPAVKFERDEKIQLDNTPNSMTGTIEGISKTGKSAIVKWADGSQEKITLRARNKIPTQSSKNKPVQEKPVFKESEQVQKVNKLKSEQVPQGKTGNVRDDLKIAENIIRAEVDIETNKQPTTNTKLWKGVTQTTALRIKESLPQIIDRLRENGINVTDDGIIISHSTSGAEFRTPIKSVPFYNKIVSKPSSGKILSISSIAASQGVDYLPGLTDEEKKRLKIIFGIGGMAGVLGMVKGLSPNGKSFFAHIEDMAKRTGLGINSVLRKSMKSEEFKSMDAGDKIALEKVLNGGRLDVAQRGIEKIESKRVEQSAKQSSIVDMYGKEVKVGVPNKRGIVINQQFADGLSSLKDLNSFEAGQFSTTDFLRATEKIDGKRNGIVRENITRPIEEANFQANKESYGLRKELHDVIKKTGVRVGSKSSKRIFQSIEGGLEGELTPKEKIAEQHLKTKYAELIDRINAERAKVNLDPIKKRQNYVTHFREMSLIDEFFGSLSDPRIPPELVVGAEHVKPNSPFFRFALERLGNKSAEDAMKAFEIYERPALNNIHQTVPLTNARAHVKHLPPNARVYFDSWLNESVANKSARLDRGVPNIIKNTLPRIAGRIAKNLILGNAQVFVTQLSSGAQTVAEAGILNSLKGIAKTLTPEGWRLAEQNSKILKLREYEGIEDINPSKFKFLEKLSAFHIEVADRMMVRMSFNAGLKKALGEGMEFKDAVKYADDFAQKTQAAYGRMFKSPIMRSKTVGSTVGQFQVYTNNLMNYVVYDLLSKRGGESNLRVAGKAATLIGTALAINQIYDELGMPIPYTPSTFIPMWNSIVKMSTDQDTQDIVDASGGGKFGTPPAISTIVGTGSGLYRVGGGYLTGDKREVDKGFNQLLKNAPILILPFGGNQVRKTIQGALAIKKDGVYSSEGKRLFKIDGADEQIKTLIFGKYGSSAAKEYLQKLEEKRSIFSKPKSKMFPADNGDYKNEYKNKYKNEYK